MLNRSASPGVFRWQRSRQGQRGLPLVVFLLLALSFGAAPAAALAQSQAGEARQVAQAEPGQSNRGMVQLLNQVEALNGELNRLRGQIEVLTNDIANAQKRQRDMYVDLDTRLRRIEQSRIEQGSSARKEQEGLAALEERLRKLEQGTASASNIPTPVASVTVAPPANPPVPSVAPAASAATLSAPSPVGTTQAPSSLPPASLSATDQAAIQRAYENAFGNYQKADYAGAIRAFDLFLKTYPKHALAANAQYWIGESYYHQRDYRAAIDAERRLLGTYPESAKVSDALLIIGTAETILGDSTAARRTYEELISKFPGSEAAEKAKSRLAKLK